MFEPLCQHVSLDIQHVTKSWVAEDHVGRSWKKELLMGGQSSMPWVPPMNGHKHFQMFQVSSAQQDGLPQPCNQVHPLSVLSHRCIHQFSPKISVFCPVSQQQFEYLLGLVLKKNEQQQKASYSFKLNGRNCNCHFQSHLGSCLPNVDGFCKRSEFLVLLVAG